MDLILNTAIINVKQVRNIITGDLLNVFIQCNIYQVSRKIIVMKIKGDLVYILM